MPSLYLVRSSGPVELRWSGVGPLSIGIVDLPINTPIRVKDVQYRSPSADGSSKVSGSKLENIKLSIKTAEQVVAELKREFHSLDWQVFKTLGEAQYFIKSGMSDRELFGITDQTTPEQVKIIYKSLVNANHPDLFMQATPEILKFQTERLAAINAAYERLSK